MAIDRSNDVVVVGGGPAGLAAAIASALGGLRVTLVDALVPPIDKACGEGLMPDGVAALRALGVDPAAHDHATFRGIRFVGRHSSAAAEFPTGHGIGLRRTVLHDALRRRAAAVGVNMCWGARVSGIARNTVFTDSKTLDTRWIVGADGQNSRVRQWVQLDSGRRTAVRIGLRRHFRLQRWTDFVEVHWGDTGQAYVTPVSDDEVCIAVISGNHRARFGDIVAECPELAKNLRGAVPLDEVRGSATGSRTLSAVTRAGVALIGEASGLVDAITGEGMTLAFRQAVALGSLLQTGDLRPYTAVHRRIGRLPNLLGSAMLLMDRNAGFQRRALHALAVNPRLLERLLAVHLGEVSPVRIGARSIARAAWHLLLPPAQSTLQRPVHGVVGSE